nr:hypothetical protein [Tanacetum cinerariifolium]
DLGILSDGDVAIVCDLVYETGLCGIPCRRAKAEYAGHVIELYVGGCGVKAINLFCVGVEGDGGDEDPGILGDGDVAIVGDLVYETGLCGIPCRRAKAKYTGHAIELHVGGCGVKAINLF